MTRQGFYRRWLHRLATIAAILGVLALMAWMQADDDLKAAEADGYARGYADGRQAMLPVVSDAYRQGRIDNLEGR